ncbi:MAG: GNAT family N-acetyltransferase [Actinomycetales bacterium]|nr:GNAT family N-acetyltransferase [Actinomycetales bacterium]
MTGRWPVRLVHGDLILRPLRLRDVPAWRRLRAENDTWLRPWEATLPVPTAAAPLGLMGMVSALRAEARAGRSYPFLLTVDAAVIGQITLGGITQGSLCSGQVGYWLARSHAGRGLMPRAVALVCDWAFTIGLHRVEVNIRPENRASIRVVDKLRLRYEGRRERYMHIDGRWCDHLSYAITAEEVPQGLLRRYLDTPQ